MSRLKDTRDAALDDEAALHRALKIVRVFYFVYGKHPVAGKLLRELADLLIAVRVRARERHQEAEALMQADRV
jgi:hypothetical protein